MKVRIGAGFRLLTAGGPSAAAQLAVAASPEARVVKAFNLCYDPEALAVVRQLVRDMGCEPFAAGELEQGAALLEATAALLIRLWVGEGVDAQSIAPPRELAGRREVSEVSLSPSS